MNNDLPSAVAGVFLPLQPLIVRDGRNFDLGSKARSLPWPYPSVTAGGLRSLAGRQGTGVEMLPDLKRLQVRGPFPWDGEKLYLPAPADMRLAAVRDGPAYEYERLSPPAEAFAAGSSQSLLATALALKKSFVRWCAQEPEQAGVDPHPSDVELAVPEVRSLEKSPPGLAWWSSEDYLAWALPNPKPLRISRPPAFAGGLPTVTRAHAWIDPGSGSNKEVFQTSGLDFGRCPDRAASGADSAARRRQWDPLGLAVDVRGAANCLQHLSAPLMTTLGGERRAAWWEPGGRIAEALAMSALVAQVGNFWRGKTCQRRLRAVLLTPAYFSTGWWPDWISTATRSGTLPGTDLRLTLVAAATKRWSGVSGWDMEHNRPKPMRRLVPAGSVFHFSVSVSTARQINFEEIHMISLCSDEQSRRDGFGLALWGVE